MTSLPPCRRHSGTILSLPDELLLEIFTRVKTYRPTNKALHRDFASSSPDIAAVRLTCRRFAATSSHLLVHYICLDGINYHSLERLEAVSCHSLIRKGVRIIRFEPRCYVPNLAKDIGQFAEWAVDRVLNLARRHRRSFEEGLELVKCEDSNSIESRERKIVEMAGLLRGIQRILDTWKSVSIEEWQNGPPHETREKKYGKDDLQQQQASDIECRGHVEDQPHIQLLREAHDLYRRRYEDQEELRKDNIFVDRFAAAMSRMPNVKCLEVQDFHDGDTSAHTSLYIRETNEHPGLLDMNHFIEPMSWDDLIQKHPFDSPPAELLFTLPMAIQNADCKLESILVRTTTRAEDYFPLLRNSIPNSSAAIGAAAHAIGLKSFAFIHSDNPKARVREAPNLEDYEAFKRYIAAMTSSGNLERFRLTVDSGWVHESSDTENALTFGGLMVSRSWRKLRDIHVTGLPIRLEDLSNLHSMLESSHMKLDFLTLSRLNLVSGTWTEALEMLREMDIVEKEVVVPIGAECDSLVMSPCSGYERIFGMNSECENEAGQFINGNVKRNPLQCVYRLRR